MPGEETKHEPAGMQTQGLYNPTTTQLHFTPVQYANYGPMLTAIENAGSNILHYLNPATIAQMKMDVASSNAGQQFLKNVQKEQLLTGMGYLQGGKFGVQAPFQNPYWRMGGGGTQQTPNNQQPPPNQQQPVQPVQPTNPANDVTKQTQQYVTGDGSGSGSGRTGDFNVGNIVPPDVQYHQAGGEVQPAPQTPQPPPQYFSSPTNTVPPPPVPAPQQSPTPISGLPGHIPYSPQSQAQAFQGGGSGVLNPQAEAQRQLEQQNLTSWQNSSQGSVLSAEEARNWARSNMDTDINRAVYLPQGGPPGPGGQREPAYAFYGKKGGSNIVPISQMVKAGAGPLVAAQNFSQVLSSSDPSNPQQPPQAAGPPGGAVSPRPASPNQPPTPVPGGPPGPPAAPGAQPPGSQVPQLPGGGTNWGALPGQYPQGTMDQLIAASTNTPQTGGPPVTSLIAGTNTAGGVPQNTNPPNINVQTGEGAVDSANDNGASVQKATGISQSQIDQDKLNYQQNGAQEVDKYTGDPVIRHLGNYTEYLSQQGKGPAYFARPGQGGFYEDVMWQGDTGWHQRLPPEEKMRQDLLDSPYGNVVGGYEAIKNMDGPTLQKHLRTWFYLNNILPNEHELPDGDSAQLRSLREDILGGTRLQHIMAGQNPANFSFYNQGENQKVKNLTGSLVPQPHGFNDYLHNFLVQAQKIPYGARQFDPRVDAAKTEYDALLHRENGLAPDAPMTDEQRINADQQFGIGSGDPSGAATLQRWINGKKEQFQQLVNTGMANRYRFPHDYLDMNDAISTNTPWLDTRDAYGPGRNAPVGDNTRAAIVHSNQQSTYTPSPTPAPSAPMGTRQGSSKANAYSANTMQQFQQMLNDPKIPPEAWITDGNGKFIQKQRALQNH